MVRSDEINRKEGNNYLMLFVDQAANWVLLAVEGKDAATLLFFAAELFKHNGHPKAITMLAIDMSPAYQKRGAGKLRQCADHVRQISFGQPSYPGRGRSGARVGPTERPGTGTIGTDQLVMAQEPRKLDRQRKSPAGAIERQAAGHWVCRRNRQPGHEPF